MPLKGLQNRYNLLQGRFDKKGQVQQDMSRNCRGTGEIEERMVLMKEDRNKLAVGKKAKRDNED